MITKLITVKNRTVLALLSCMLMILTQCEKDLDTTGTDITIPVAKCTDDSPSCGISEWGEGFDLEDGQFLTDTPGLRRMALSGSHSQLRLDVNGTNGGNIPNDICDDPEKDGFASRRTYGNWVVAMYHPTTYPDHFITYNSNTGCWIRWELNNGNPIIFRKS